MEPLHDWNLDTYRDGWRDENVARVTERNLTDIWQKLNELIEAFNTHVQKAHHDQEN